ncbi:polyprenyl synthetase family protein [Nicoliella lavandulae]|uniref:Polyprenyl synthetase family protein n=1 Tax=Nicoliella lavandulae TaxID=3082954 RepID=A0ABU8SKX6_9LACO
MAIDEHLSRFEAQYRPQINACLANDVSADVDQATLASSMQYSLNAGGKRLRPLITMAVLKTLGHPIDATNMKAICAVELLHTYSLIHDDLPAMDDDDLRRGEPTNHVKFGAGMATLAGDGLLTLAFQWLVDNQLPPHTKLALVSELAKMAGPAGMVAGQADDIQFENQRLPLAKLQTLHRHKTGDLISYVVSAGMIIADDMSAQPYLDRFGQSFGLAFQIYDDILDVTSSANQLGKPVHQDDNKNTYPNLLGLKASYQALHDTIADGQAALSDMQTALSIDTTLLSSFFSYFQV